MVAVITLEIERIGKVNRLVVVAASASFIDCRFKQIVQYLSPIAVYIAVPQRVIVVVNILRYLGGFDVARHRLGKQEVKDGCNAAHLRIEHEGDHLGCRFCVVDIAIRSEDGLLIGKIHIENPVVIMDVCLSESLRRPPNISRIQVYRDRRVIGLNLGLAILLQGVVKVAIRRHDGWLGLVLPPFRADLLQIPVGIKDSFGNGEVRRVDLVIMILSLVRHVGAVVGMFNLQFKNFKFLYTASQGRFIRRGRSQPFGIPCKEIGAAHLVLRCVLVSYGQEFHAGDIVSPFVRVQMGKQFFCALHLELEK